MPKKLEHLTRLQAAIQQAHHCDAVHSRTVPVQESLDGKILWEGDVEVFELRGHAAARRCFAWSYHEKNGGERFISVLERQNAKSPQMAVRSAIFFDVQPAPYPRCALSS